MRRSNVAILINEAANAGKAKGRWERIKNEVLAGFNGNVLIKLYEPPYDLGSYLKECADLGVCNYIVGGGDGTLNYVANILYKFEGAGFLKDYVLGALALGSSNDFFKPSSRLIKNIPVRINMEKPKPSDRGAVRIRDAQNKTIEKVFLVNAGLGVTAQANYLFNHPNTLIAFLKPRATQLAIIVTAVLTILGHRNRTIQMEIHEGVSEVQMSNLSITIIPFISGSFRYKKERDTSGVFDIYLCRNMGRMALLKTLIDLSSGKFREGKNRVIDTATTVEITSGNEIPLELDGEIFMGYDFKFELNANAILLAS